MEFAFRGRPTAAAADDEENGRLRRFPDPPPSQPHGHGTTLLSPLLRCFYMDAGCFFFHRKGGFWACLVGFQNLPNQLLWGIDRFTVKNWHTNFYGQNHGKVTGNFFD